MFRFLFLLTTFLRYRLYAWAPFRYQFFFYPLFLIAPWALIPASYRTKEERLRIALEKMGPIFIKFGQLLSTRKDLLSLQLADELALLQDNVNPFPSEEALKICKRVLKEKFDDFSFISEQPIAAASVAQVYSGILKGVDRVILKIRRPNLLKILKKDIFILKGLVYIFSYAVIFARSRLMAVVQEFEEALLAESDFIREAANASQMKRNFQEQKILYIPKIYWDYTCTELLVMEEVSGLSVKQIFSNPLSDSHQKLLSQNIFLIFLKQVFEHSFFHADMHPGNIFIDLDTLSEPRYIFVDFGIIGTLSDKDQRYLAENLLAFFEQDYRKVALLHLQSGWVQPNISLSHFEFSIRAVCEPIFQRPLKDISVGETFLKLIKVAQQHKIIIQPQLILLQKTILAVEGLSRRLCPELDLWTAIYPYVKNAVRMKFGLVGELRKTWTRLPLLLEKFNQDHSLETLNKLKKRYQYSAWLFIDGLYWISILFNTSLYVMGSYRSFEEYIMIIALHVIVILIIKNRHKEI